MTDVYRRKFNEQKDGYKKSPYGKALLSAKNAKNVNECPYKKGSWRSFWLKQFELTKQIDFIDDAR